VSRQLAAELGFCITATSANLSGAEPTPSAAVVASTLGEVIDLVLDEGDSPGGPASTIVDLRDAVPQLLRAGAVAWDRVLRSIR
jgi:L-threonylcarbamoyladenylate synthase